MPRPLVGHYTHAINDIRAFDFMLLDEQEQEQDDDHEQEADMDEQDHEQDEQVSLLVYTTTMI